MKKIAFTLLIDDDDITNIVNQMLLEDLDLTDELLIARNGKEALELIERRQRSQECLPNLILLDINMPVMNGFEFLTAFEKLEIEARSSVIIVMLTTSMNPEDVKIAQETTIGGYLNKPLTENDLQKVWERFFSD